MQIRQGDVLLTPVQKLPKGLKKVNRDTRNRLVIAEGEATGHAHCILDGLANLFVPEDLQELSDRYLVVEEECEIVHDEHSALTIEPGIYKLPAQREYTSADMAPLRVAD
jgi:hypothetical protein